MIRMQIIQSNKNQSRVQKRRRVDQNDDNITKRVKREMLDSLAPVISNINAYTNTASGKNDANNHNELKRKRNKPKRYGARESTVNKNNFFDQYEKEAAYTSANHVLSPNSIEVHSLNESMHDLCSDSEPLGEDSYVDPTYLPSNISKDSICNEENVAKKQKPHKKKPHFDISTSCSDYPTSVSSTNSKSEELNSILLAHLKALHKQNTRIEMRCKNLEAKVDSLQIILMNNPSPVNSSTSWVELSELGLPVDSHERMQQLNQQLLDNIFKEKLV